MKWIGQHIWSLISRFRSDVYFENVENGASDTDKFLIIESSGKLKYRTGSEVLSDIGAGTGSGDLTAIVAGDGLVGEDLSGPIPTLSVDAALASLTSFGSEGATTNIVAGDLTMYNAVNNGNPTISLGSSATNRLEIEAKYNDGTGGTTHQHLDEVNFKVYTDSSTTNDGRFKFYVDEVLTMGLLDGSASIYGDLGVVSDDAKTTISDSTASSATQGGKLILQSDDNAAMGDDHRLGVIEFKGAEDASNNRTIGARIEAMCDAAWSASENGGRLDFYTTDGNASESKVLTLDSDKLATFAGDLTVNGASFLLESSSADSPLMKLTNTTDDDQASRFVFEKLRDDDGVGTGQNLGEIWFKGQDASQHVQYYGYILSEIDVSTHGQESGKLTLGVAAHDGGTNAGLKLTGGSVDNEVDVEIGRGANSVTTVDGEMRIAPTGAIFRAGIPNIYGSVIKLIPSDFMANDDGGNQKFGVGYVETDGAGYGMRTANNLTELFAFVSIPEGMMATHVDIFDKNDLAVEVFEAQINATTMVSKGSGNANTTIDITDVASTATNFLAIQVTTTSATNDKVYGGYVTIAIDE